jgi:hypothetical protein
VSREYNLAGSNVSVTNAATTLVFINPGASQGFELLRLWAGQTGTATSAQYWVRTNTQVTAFPTVTSTTPTKLKFNDPASGITGGTSGAAGTAGINASAEGAGTKTYINPGDTMNNLNGYLWVPTPRELIALSAGIASGFGFGFGAAPGSLSGWQFGATYGEIG